MLSVTADKLSVNGDSNFTGLSYFANTTAFNGGVVFGGSTEFTVPPLFNKDTGGFAVVKAGSKKVDVVFENPYIAQPVVNASITLEDDVNQLTDEEANAFFDQGISFIVTNKTANGFTVRINKNSTKDVKFSWTALSIKDPTVFESVIDGLIIETQLVETPTEPDTSTTTGEGDTINPGTGDTNNTNNVDSTTPDTTTTEPEIVNNVPATDINQTTDTQILTTDTNTNQVTDTQASTIDTSTTTQ